MGKGKFPCGAAGKGSSMATAVAQTAAQVSSQTWELPHAVGESNK